MPIVFVHGVNNRAEDTDYDKGIARKTKFLQTLLSPRTGITSPHAAIEFPYWGDEGVKFRWKQASVPSGSDDVEALALGSAEANAASLDIWLNEARFQHGEQGVNLGELSKRQGFSTAVDLIWDTASAVQGSDAEYGDLLEGYAASMAYAEDHPVPPWAFQDPPLSNQAFVDRLLTEIQPYRPDQATESLGLRDWFQSMREALSRLAHAPGDVATTVAVKLARKSVHASASRFLGDIFIYLHTRGTVNTPGRILQDVLAKLRAANAARTTGDDKLVVIGHSLGGVITYDILTHFAPEIRVDTLITVGSQVALFEEMALYRASDPKVPANPGPQRLPRPANVGRWLNVYDTNDIFSFLAGKVFEDVDDYRFDTGYGLLAAHGGYFERPSFYKRLAARLSGDA